MSLSRTVTFAAATWFAFALSVAVIV
jgi:hypothetical protein